MRRLGSSDPARDAIPASEATEALLARVLSDGGQIPSENQPRPRRVTLGWLAVTAAVAVSAAVAAGALVLLGKHPSGRVPASVHATLPGPPAGPQPPVAGDGYTAAAFNAAYRVRGCSPGPTTHGSSIDQGPPSQTTLNLLPILRRPRGPADQLPAQFNRQLRLGFGPLSGGVYIHYVRLARTYRGTSFYIVPLARIGPPPVSAAVAERCYQAAVHSLREQLAHAHPSAAIRRRVLRYGLYQFAEWRFNLTHQSVHPGAFLLASMRNGSAGGSRATLSMIAQRGLLGASGNPHGNVVWYGIVPSTAHSVTFKFPGGRQGSQLLPPITVSGVVVNNVFIVTVPDFGPLRSWPSTMIWRNAAGRTIKTINEEPFHP